MITPLFYILSHNLLFVISPYIEKVTYKSIEGAISHFTNKPILNRKIHFAKENIVHIGLEGQLYDNQSRRVS